MLMENIWGITKASDRKLIFMEFMDRSKCNDLRYTDNKKSFSLNLKCPTETSKVI